MEQHYFSLVCSLVLAILSQVAFLPLSLSSFFVLGGICSLFYQHSDEVFIIDVHYDDIHSKQETFSSETVNYHQQ